MRSAPERTPQVQLQIARYIPVELRAGRSAAVACGPRQPAHAGVTLPGQIGSEARVPTGYQTQYGIGLASVVGIDALQAIPRRVRFDRVEPSRGRIERPVVHRVQQRVADSMRRWLTWIWRCGCPRRFGKPCRQRFIREKGRQISFRRVVLLDPALKAMTFCIQTNGSPHHLQVDRRGFLSGDRGWPGNPADGFAPRLSAAFARPAARVLKRMVRHG